MANARQAFRFYERCLGGEIVTMMTHGAAPAEYARGQANRADKIFHATLRIGDAELMGGDVPPGQYQNPAGFCVTSKSRMSTTQSESSARSRKTRR